MNSLADLKLEIFRKIDSMNDVEVLEAYNRLIKLTEASDNYKASPAEEKAIEIGLNQVKEGKVKYHGEVIKGFRQKLRNK